MSRYESRVSHMMVGHVGCHVSLLFNPIYGALLLSVTTPF